VKIAFTTTGEDLQADLDARFGRAPKIIVYDTETKSFDVVDNTQNLNAPQGAGIQAAQNVARAGAQCLVTGHCGPNAYRVLHAAGIAVYTTEAPTVAEALRLFLEGRLSQLGSPDVEGHWT